MLFALVPATGRGAQSPHQKHIVKFLENYFYMKSYTKKTNIILSCLIMLSCVQGPVESKQSSKRYYKITTEQLNDSTTEFTNWIDSTKADCFLISKADTLDRYRYKSKDLYYSYLHFKKDSTFYKLKQFVRIKPNDIRLNEIVYIDEQKKIDEKNSSYIHMEPIGDSLKIRNPNSTYFNKLRILIGEEKTFNRDEWKKIDTIVSFAPYIMISLNNKGRKCIFQTIQTDSKGIELGGQDFYFDIENLKYRDITKSLVW